MAKSINMEVALRDGETSDRLIRRFIKKMKKSSILDEYRERLYYVKPSDKKRRKKAQLRRAAQKTLEEQKKIEAERNR